MAADTRAYTPNRYPIGLKSKARKLADGTLIGVSSNIPGGGEAVMDWYADGADPEDHPTVAGFELLAVNPDGEGFYAHDHFLLSGPLLADFWAIGSGAEAALGALHLGAPAAAAVDIASRVDPFTNDDIDTIEH